MNEFLRLKSLYENKYICRESFNKIKRILAIKSVKSNFENSYYAYYGTESFYFVVEN